MMMLNLKPADYVSISSLACAIIAMVLIFLKELMFVPWLIFLSITLDYSGGYIAMDFIQISGKKVE